MMNSDEINDGKTLTFLDILNNSKIEIPIVQRDYAQGRKENGRVRQAFLQALKDSIVESKKIKLDFIYGNNSEEAFQPLDGQQRLTTLFLLHWYAATKENKLDETVKRILSNFSYETRISSREFCKDLVEKSIVICEEDDNLSSKIVDSNWFFLSWKLDPTISAMLNTIDDIHKSFFEITNLWEILSSSKIITFNYLILKDFGLSDDLYIKMNARGKLLTTFENFKAGVQQKIKQYEWENKLDFENSFLLKIDTKWADFFWNNFKKKNSTDEAQMNFIKTLLMISVARDSNLGAEDIRRLQEDTSALNLLNYINKDSFEFIYNIYEMYSKIDLSKLSLDLEFWRHQSKKSITSTIMIGDDESSSSSYTQKVLFYAQTEYIVRNSISNNTKYEEWMHVIRNIISRGNVDQNGKRPDIIRSPDTFHGVINLINELASGSEDIYKYLNTHTLKSTFAKEQIEEERRKAKIIIHRPELKELIFKTEDNELLRGRITFVLDCIGYKNEPEKLNVELLSNVQKVFEKYFSDDSCLSDELRRAMLTIDVDGKFDFYSYWWSYWNVANATKRKLIVQFRELEYYMYSEQSEYFKKLVLQLINKNYQQIITEFIPPADMPNWKKRLIKEPDLLGEKCQSKYIAIPEDESFCYLLKSQRPRELADGYKVY
ncbi:DUF262 domain-containing protein [Pseudolactococcus raffinolactis]|uniref:DUF262 domain-containing protein n=1 Tax=Pseudolactococcus raffinolactis TaxID=1366 RepID=UPI0024163496|nr:DUF262 domain-containing protein [Lactococcus raffinolactis]MDG4961985.1 DUF262 domain-containing protein [Lactococcus raffinolactis]